LEYILDIKNPSSEKLHSHYKEILNLQQQLLDNQQIFDFDLEKVLTALDKSKKKKVYILFVSATPAEYEIQVSNNTVVEQIIRPTGLVDPEIEVIDSKYQVERLYDEIKQVINKNEKVLVKKLPSW